MFYRKTNDGEMGDNETEKVIKALREKLSQLSSRRLVIVAVHVTQYIFIYHKIIIFPTNELVFQTENPYKKWRDFLEKNNSMLAEYFIKVKWNLGLALRPIQR